MAAIVFPQEAIVEYVKQLLSVAADTSRDAATLARQARSLMSEGRHGRVMGTLRRYARNREEGAVQEIRQIVTDMETFVACLSG